MTWTDRAWAATWTYRNLIKADDWPLDRHSNSTRNAWVRYHALINYLHLRLVRVGK